MIKELYAGEAKYVAPWDVKKIIGWRARQFQGFAQHDSQEMLSFLLETLHEDLNKVTKKPYIEYKDSNDRPDQEVSQEFWEGFKKREKSIFVDLFYGQLKSRVQCTKCDKVSIAFDPFNMLSLPIPQGVREVKFSIKYYPRSLTSRPKNFTFAVSDHTTI